MLDFSEMNIEEDNLPKNQENKEVMSHIENFVFPEECSKNKTCSSCNIIEQVRQHISKINDIDIESGLLDAYFNEVTGAIHVKNNYSDTLNNNEKMKLSTVINSYSARVKFLLNHTPEQLKDFFENTDFFGRKGTKSFVSNFEEVNKILEEKIFEELFGNKKK